MLAKADDDTGLILNTNHDPNGYFGKYLRTGQFLNFRRASTVEDRQLLSAMRECEDFVENWLYQDFPLEDLLNHLFNRLKFVYHQIVDERVVYTVFEAQNSRGLEVPWLDRLKSMLMAIVFESREADGNSDLINEVHHIWSDIYRTIGTRVGPSHEALRFAATLHRFPAPPRPISKDDEAAELLRDEASGSPIEAIRVSKWIRSVTRAVYAMDRAREDRHLDVITETPQARLFATAVRLRTDLAKLDKERILRRWESVTFRIYGMGRSNAGTGRRDFTRVAWEIVNPPWRLTAEQIMRELQTLGSLFPIDSAVRALRRTNCYMWMKGEPLVYFFRRYEEHLASEADQKLDKKRWRQYLHSGNPYETIEHILPQTSGRDHVHWLGNLMLLPRSLNTSLSDDSPKEKAESYRNTGLWMAKMVADQVSEGWTKRDIVRRESALLKWARGEWAD